MTLPVIIAVRGDWKPTNRFRIGVDGVQRQQQCEVSRYSNLYPLPPFIETRWVDDPQTEVEWVGVNHLRLRTVV
jgi:hypothetical protein